MRNRLLLACLCMSLSQVQAADYGAPSDPQIGGGKLYTDVLENRVVAGDYTAETLGELLSALSNAGPGDVVFVPGDVTIDFSTHYSPLQVTEGVTLSSDRGVNGSKGALLKTDVRHSHALLEVMGDDVRLTGFRLQGPHSELHHGAQAKGIQSTGHDGLSVDNLEIYHWSFAGVRLNAGTTNATIAHSSIHHNLHANIGYGVVLYGDAKALIHHNLFDFNRHSIAGSGSPGQAYEAHSNIVLRHSKSHAFDMHGHAETGGSVTDPTAGERIDIHHNTFLLGGYAINIRGIPSNGASVTHNRFLQPGADSAIRQLITQGTANAYGITDMDDLIPYSSNLVIADNEYAQDGDMTYGDFETGTGILETMSNDVFWVAPREPDHNGTIRRDWYVSYDGNQPWKKLQNSTLTCSQMVIKDFDGDGMAEVFKARWGEWSVSHGGAQSWQLKQTSNSDMALLAFADVDGDSATDVIHRNWRTVSLGGSSSWVNAMLDPSVNLHTAFFVDAGADGQTDAVRAVGNDLEVSWGAQTAFETLGSRAFVRGNSAFGDFDGDGKNDEFRLNGDAWEVRYHDDSAFQVLSSGHSESLDDLAFGDFDGDGSTDVFRVDGQQWQYASAGQGAWVNLQSFGGSMASLAFGDFDGDGTTDVFTQDFMDRWIVSWKGVSNWVIINSSGVDMSRYAFVDMNHDGSTDVAYSVNGVVKVSMNGAQGWVTWNPTMSR